MAPSPLDPATVTDNAQLAGAIGRLLIEDADWHRHSTRVREAQDRLRPLCPPEAWQAYLAVEQVTNERLAAALEVVARWAWNEGREGT